MPGSRDFIVTIHATESVWTISARLQNRVINATAPVEYDLQQLTVQQASFGEFVRHIAQTVLQVQIHEPHNISIARQLGLWLYDTALSGEIAALYNSAISPPGSSLRVQLVLPHSLAALPWELLCNRNGEKFLAIDDLQVCLIRSPGELDQGRSPVPGFEQLHTPLRVVAVLCNAGGFFPDIDVENHRQLLERLFGLHQDLGRVSLDIIQGPDTLSQLEERLKEPAHILHILCHGDLNVDQGVLFFEGAEGEPGGGEPALVSLDLLRQLLARARMVPLQLITLNACLSGHPVPGHPFSSIGSTLVWDGFPAALAMQSSVHQQVVDELTEYFYERILRGWPIDQALSEARLALFEKYQDSLEWAIPVLFMHPRVKPGWVLCRDFRDDPVIVFLTRHGLRADASSSLFTRRTEQELQEDGLPEFVIEPPLVDKAQRRVPIEALVTGDNQVVFAPAGYGKTNCRLQVAGRLRRRGNVLVANLVLSQQLLSGKSSPQRYRDIVVQSIIEALVEQLKGTPRRWNALRANNDELTTLRALLEVFARANTRLPERLPSTRELERQARRYKGDAANMGLRDFVEAIAPAAQSAGFNEICVLVDGLEAWSEMGDGLNRALELIKLLVESSGVLARGFRYTCKCFLLASFETHMQDDGLFNRGALDIYRIPEWNSEKLREMLDQRLQQCTRRRANSTPGVDSFQQLCEDSGQHDLYERLAAKASGSPRRFIEWAQAIVKEHCPPGADPAPVIVRATLDTVLGVSTSATG